MKVTIIYDNTVFRNDLQADWGFSALVETQGKRILFDTGGSGSILLANMSRLGISPREIDEVFISHAHFDHIGGLSAFLDQNHEVRVYVPRSFRGVKHAAEVVAVDHADELSGGIYSTGELDGIEQSLCIETRKGIVMVAGCSHPRMENMIAAASEFGTLYGIIGGLHGHGPESLKDFQFICATHCTQYQKEIMSFYPERYVAGGAGTVIDLQDQENAG
ncbi:MAG: MBL fold metallo-hydrolase [Desulfobacteraceae bacterium]|nr:MAG: MBL fold metallo-hydrolase [Desulfobacteraceae bacterium]